MEVKGQHLLLEAVDFPYCTTCECHVHVVYARSAGAWICTGCGVSFGPSLEGDGWLHTRAPFVAADDDEAAEAPDEGAPNSREGRKRRLDEGEKLQRTAQRFRLDADDGVHRHALPECARRLAHSLRYSDHVATQARALAERWVAVPRRRRFHCIETAASAVLLRVLFDLHLPRTRLELRSGAGCGPWRRAIASEVVRLSEDLQLQPAYTPATQREAFLRRFVSEHYIVDSDTRAFAERYVRLWERVDTRSSLRPDSAALGCLYVAATRQGARRTREAKQHADEWAELCGVHLGLTVEQMRTLGRRVRGHLLKHASEVAEPADAPTV